MKSPSTFYAVLLFNIDLDCMIYFTVIITIQPNILCFKDRR